MGKKFTPADSAEPGASLTWPLGSGMARLQPRLPAFRGITTGGRAALVVTQGGYGPQLLYAGAEAGARFGAAWGAAKAYEGSSWLARNLYLPLRQKQALSETVSRSSTAGAAVGFAAVGGALLGVSKLGELADRRQAALMVASLMSMACQSPEGTIPLWNEVLRASVLEPFRLRAATRDKLLAAPVVAGISEIRELFLPAEMRPVMAAFLFAARAGALGERPSAIKDAREFVALILVRAGMPLAAARDLAATCARDYAAGRPYVDEHYRALQAAVAGVGLDLGLPLKTILDAATTVGGYDPYEEGRRANQALLGAVIKKGGTLGTSWIAGDAHPALSVARSVATRLFAGPGGPDRAAVEASWRRYRTAQGITGEDAG